MHKGIKSYYVLIVIFVGILVLGTYHVSRKSGYYVDEGMTLFLANGQYNGAVTSVTEYGFTDFLSTYVWKDNITATVRNVYNMLQEVLHAGNYSEEGTVEWYDAARKMLQGESTWISGETLYEQISVTEQTRFQYPQVYLNQMLDVHPPLYYMLVHTVFSVWAGEYFDFYLFGINIVLLLGTCAVLYCTVIRFWNNMAAAVLAVALYGFSQGFFSCALYFRMYAMETFFVLLTLWLHLYMKEKHWELRKWEWLRLDAIVLLGFMTHYYYILFMIPLFIVTVCRMWGGEENRQKLWIYFRNMLCTGIVSLVIWPFSVYHIFFGYRGTEAMANFNFHGILNKLALYGTIFAQAFFFDSTVVLVLVLFAMLVYCIWRWGKYGEKLQNWQEIVIPSIVYGIIVIKIAPAVSDRYVMCLFPIIGLLMAIVLTNIISVLMEGSKTHGIILLVGGIYVICSVCFTTPNYLYLERKDNKLGIEEEKRREMNCLMIADEDYRGFPEAYKLAQFHQVMVVRQADLALLTVNKPQDSTMDILVYVYNCPESEELLISASQMLSKDYSGVQQISSDIEGFEAYIFKGK